MNYKIQWLTITEQFAGQRIDNFLLSKLKGVPRSHIYRILRDGQVRVNKKRVKPHYRLVTDDLVRIPPIRTKDKAEPLSLSSDLKQILSDSILYEDNKLLIINKPIGLAVHGGSGVAIGLIEALRLLFPQEKNLSLAHRLDRETSGCVVCCKRNSMLRTIHELFRNNTINKTYTALLCGQVTEKTFEVSQALGKNVLKSGERIAVIDPEGKPATTEFEIIQRFENTTLVKAKPITGRMHQIRVHAASIGHPIVGDAKYGNRIVNNRYRKAGLNRLFLHARQLQINDLPDYPTISVVAPYDEQYLQIVTHGADLPPEQSKQ